ncbi:MAG: methyltransferase domain-containing protein [Pseudomonadota bacterium]|nr:methyltransferase domain-containing protein [Pseudomonadota bacterium]
MSKRYKVQFPRETINMDQNEAFFHFFAGGEKHKLRFHDYNEIFKFPGLYEQLFYDRLKCCSHNKVSDILKTTVEQQSNLNFSELRVLDLGAGNGMVGEALKDHGVSRMVGVDIFPEAEKSCERDRPGVYDDYYTTDLTKLGKEEQEDMESWSLNCFTTVAALGYGDIPPKAFFQAFNLIESNSWVAFNIKETFLDNSDTSGFSKAIRELIFSEYLDLHHLERYRHRFSIDGTPLYYFAIAGKKNAHIPDSFLSKLA